MKYDWDNYPICLDNNDDDNLFSRKRKEVKNENIEK
jgi:hypothetical protein